MKDTRDPTHVYLDIMEAKTAWNEGILAAADRVERERTERAQASVSGPPSEIPAYHPSLEKAPQNGAQGHGMDSNGDLI